MGCWPALVVGGVWVVAGALKLPDPDESVRAVRAYQLLPEAVVPLVGHALPVVEVLVGACLLVGLLTRGSGGRLRAAADRVRRRDLLGLGPRALQIECGCFGGGAGPAENAAAAVPLGDRPRRRAAAAQRLAGLAARAPRGPLDNRLLPA